MLDVENKLFLDCAPKSRFTNILNHQYFNYSWEQRTWVSMFPYNGCQLWCY